MDGIIIFDEDNYNLNIFINGEKKKIKIGEELVEL